MPAIDRHQRIDEANRVYASGRPREAAEMLGACLSLFGDDERETPEFAHFAVAYGSALAESGQLKAAQQVFGAALAIYTAAGDEAQAALVHFNLGNVASYTNSRQPMFDHYQGALEMFRRLDRGPMMALCLMALATLWITIGQFERAEALLLEFDDLDPRDTDNVDLRRSYEFQRARIHRARDDFGAAASAFSRALHFAEQTGNARYVAEARRALLDAERRGETTAKDIEQLYFEEKQRQSRDFVKVAYGFAKALAAAGDDDRAATVFEEALDAIDGTRGQLDGGERYHFMENHSVVGRTFVAFCFDRGHFARALEASERVHARAYLDLAFRHQIKRQGGRSIAGTANGRLLLSTARLPEIVDDLAASVTHALTLYYCDRRLFVWFLAPDGTLDGWEASDANAALEKLAGALIAVNAEGDESELSVQKANRTDAWGAVAAALDEVAPLLLNDRTRRHLREQRGRLIVVPHLGLHDMPFAALPLGDGLVLGERWQVSLTPSLSAHLQLDPRRDPGPSGGVSMVPALIVGDCGRQRVQVKLFANAPTLEYDFVELPGARLESERIGAIYDVSALMGEHVSKAFVRSQMQICGVAHFATHGYWLPGTEHSFLLLGRGPSGQESNMLLARDVQRLSIRADLVVLSACQTGLGAIHPDSYIGLAQSFLIAGARAVLVSLWPVSDEATATLMERFHQRVCAGETPAEALRESQAELRDNPDFPDNLAWASFQFVGRPYSALDAPAKEFFDGPVFSGGDVVWSDGAAGELFPLAQHEQLRQEPGQGFVISRTKVVALNLRPAPPGDAHDDSP